MKTFNFVSDSWWWRDRLFWSSRKSCARLSPSKVTISQLIGLNHAMFILSWIDYKIP